MLITKLLTDKPVAYHPFLARVAGGVTAGLFLSQLFYWSDRGKDPEGWIYKKQTEFEEETALTRREQETARKRLLQQGLIEEKLKGVPPVLHYRICWDQLIFNLAESAKSICTNPTNQNGGLRQNIDTENTTEITSTPELFHNSGEPAEAKPADWVKVGQQELLPVGRAVEQERVINSRQRPKSSRRSEITDEYIEELVQEFRPKLGGGDRARVAIDSALNHKALNKAIDKKRYLKNWLRRDVVAYQESRQSGGRKNQAIRLPPGALLN